MFRVKICGVTTPDDAQMVVSWGADAVGLNFYAGSPRFITLDRAREISAAVGSAAQLVAVFVNETVANMRNLATDVGFDWVQLHGDEPPELVAKLKNEVQVIRVCRLSSVGVSAIAEDIAACRAAGGDPSAVLVDATTPDAYGGTGEQLPWPQLVDYRSKLGDTPLVLAGGLHPANVERAIRIVGPAAVDVASGVERQPGVKDPELVRAFVQAAHRGLRS